MNDIIDTFTAGEDMKLIGIVTIVLGFLAIAAPLAAGISVAFLVGLVVLVGGIARLTWAFQAGNPGKGLPGFAIGVLTLVCGVVLVSYPLVTSGVLTLLLAAYLLLDGGVEIVAAFQVRPASGWGWLLVGGFLSLLLGVMIWQQFPLSGAWAIGVLLGFKLLLVGVIMLGVSPRVKPA